MLESIAAREAGGSEFAQESRATLASFFLAVERRHDRPAVVERRAGGRAERTPDWRFHRQVLRIALYLRERCGFRAGDRVAILAPLRPEWLVFDWATVVQGGCVVLLDPGAPAAQVCGAWEEHAPRVALVPATGDGARLFGLAPAARSLERVLALGEDAEQGRHEGVMTFGEALDLGGTLDTAERANSMRAQARAVGASQLASAYPHTGESLTNGDVAARLHMRGAPSALARKVSTRTEEPPVVHVVESTPVTPTLHTALYAYVADGKTCVAFGARGEVDNIRRSVHE